MFEKLVIGEIIPLQMKSSEDEVEQTKKRKICKGLETKQPLQATKP